MDIQDIKTPIPFWAVKLAKRSFIVYHFYATLPPDPPREHNWRYYYDKWVSINFRKGLVIKESPKTLVMGKERPQGEGLSFNRKSLRARKWRLIKEKVKLRDNNFLEDNTFLNRYMIYAIFEGY